MAQPPRPTAVPSLLESSLESLARHIDRCASLQPLPEELAQPLFARVLELGKLTPRVLRLFQDTQHEWVLQRIKALQIRDPPPLIMDTRNKWLGDKSNLY